MRRLLDQLQREHKLDVDPALLSNLDLSNPLYRRMFKEWMAKHAQGGKISQEDALALAKRLEAVREQISQMRLPTDFEPFPILPFPREGAGNGANSSIGPEDDQFGRLLEDWLRNSEDTRLVELLSDSDAFRQGIEDLRRLIDIERGGSAWDLDRLPEHLRFAEGLKLDLGATGLVDRLKNLSMPSLPSVKLPRINLGRWGVPSVPLPGLGGAGSSRLGETLLWALVAVVGAVLLWQIVKNLGGRGSLAAARGLGPWPVDPAKVATAPS